jgi:hypothetical protein
LEPTLATANNILRVHPRKHVDYLWVIKDGDLARASPHLLVEPSKVSLFVGTAGAHVKLLNQILHVIEARFVTLQVVQRVSSCAPAVRKTPDATKIEHARMWQVHTVIIEQVLGCCGGCISY